MRVIPNVPIRPDVPVRPSPILWARQNLAVSSPVWLRLAVVLGVLLVSFALGYKGSSDQLQYVLMGIAGVPVVFVFLRWPTLGIFGIIASGMLIKYTGPGGMNATVALVLLLVGLWVLDQLVFQNEIRIVISRTMPPLYALLVISFISFGMGQLPWFTYVQSAPLDAQAGGFASYALSYAAYFLIANHVKTLRTLQWMTWAFVALGTVYVAGLLVLRALYLVGLLIPSMITLFGEVFGTLGSNFYIWLIAIAYSQAIFNNDLRPKWRILLGGIALTGVYVLLVLKFKDKSGWGPILVVVWMITALRSWRLAMTVLIAGVLGGIPFIPQLLESESYSLSTRLEILPIFWQLIQANPVFGIGFANYHFYTELFSLRGWYTTFNSHNNYVDVAVQTGLLGLVCFLWFFGRVGVLAWELRERVTSGFAKAYVNGAIGGIVGMLLVSALGDWVLPFVYNIGLSGFRISVIGWLFLGGLVVLEQIYYPPDEV